MRGDGPEVSARRADDGVWMVRVAGDLDDGNATELDAALHQGLRSGCRLTVVDASGMTFADSSVLDALLRTRNEHVRTGAELVIAGPLGAAVRRLFDVTGTTEAFRLADSVQSAMTSRRTGRGGRAVDGGPAESGPGRMDRDRCSEDGRGH
jgi:anti-sigma B factor antagonist